MPAGHHTPRINSGASVSHIGAVHHGVSLAAGAAPSWSGAQYIDRKWFRKPTKMTIKRIAMTKTAQLNDGRNPARMMVNSLRNSPKGGAPVMATAPASQSAAEVGKRRPT